MRLILATLACLLMAGMTTLVLVALVTGALMTAASLPWLAGYALAMAGLFFVAEGSLQ